MGIIMELNCSSPQSLYLTDSQHLITTVSEEMLFLTSELVNKAI